MCKAYQLVIEKMDCSEVLYEFDTLEQAFDKYNEITDKDAHGDYHIVKYKEKMITNPNPVMSNGQAKKLAEAQNSDAGRLNSLRDQVNQANIEAGWRDNIKKLYGLLNNYNFVKDSKLIVEHSTLLENYIVSTNLALIHSEISEALEGFRKRLMDDHLPDRPMIEVELADALIRIMDLAGYLDLDIGGALVEKMEYNRNRADHKRENRNKVGGKKF
jgi:NTP pyrophosphatase (non-canonical NTP hydrolase)